MKNFKKVVAGLLALLMLALSVNVTFAAEEYTEKEAVVVAKVNAAGIMQGTDKGFEPTKTLTRAEAAAIMVRMKGISEDTVKQNAGTTLFTDVPASHWAAGYVNVASNYNIIKGVGAGKFAPEKEVSVAEFYTMAIRALGAGQLVEAEGTWPTNYVNFAIENDLAKDVAQIYTATATRMTAATIAVNALTANMWTKKEVVTNGEITWKEDAKTILKDVLKITAIDGSKIIEDDDDDYLLGQCVTVSNKDHDFNGIKVDEDLDLSNIKVGLVYDYWLNEDGEIIGIWETEKSDLEKVEFTEIVKVTTVSSKITKVTLKVDGKDKEYKTVGGDLGFFSLNEDDDAAIPADGSTVFGVAYLNGTKLAAIYGEQYSTYAIVDEVKNKTISFKDVTTEFDAEDDITLDDEKIDYFFTKDGEAIKVTDLEEDDAIAFYAIENDSNKIVKYVGKVLTDKVEGKITAVSTTKSTVKVDGTSYEATDATLFAALSDKLKSEIIAYTNEAGKIAMFDVVEEAAGNVAIVKSIKTYSEKGENVIDVVLYYADGTESDTLRVDLDETKDEDSTLDTAQKIVDKYTPGHACVYSISGDKLTFVKENAKAEYIPATTGTGKGLVFKKSSATVNNGAIEVDENTKFFQIKLKDDGVKVKSIVELDYDSLDDTDFQANSWLADIKYDGTTPEYAGMVVFYGGKVNREAELNLAFVEDFEAGDKEKTIYVITLDGERTHYTVDDNADVYSSLKAALVGNVIDLKVVDDKLVEIDELKAETDPEEDTLIDSEVINTFVTKYNSKKTNMTLNGISDTYYFADNMLVLLEDDGEYEVGSIKDIEDYTNLDDVDEYDNVIKTVEYVNEVTAGVATDKEVVLIVYTVTEK